MNRRQFLKMSGAAAMAMAAAGAGAGAGCASTGARPTPRGAPRVATSRPVGANGDIRVAVVGFNQQGRQHIKAYRGMPGVRVVALCDVDERVLNTTADELDKDAKGVRVERYRDLRKLLESREVDAVSCALPVRWHSLAGIWACQAGKHAYVEKPVSHCIWEGRKLVEAARRHRRLVQAGLNNRSRPAQGEVFSFMRSGQLGRIVFVRAWDYKRRETIGKVAGPQKIPEHVDYDLWTGPGPMLPLMREKFHYDWHWQWAIGAGEIGNNGVHQLDMVRWALGKEGLPRTVTSFGGRYGYVDDGQTPNTHVAVYDYDGIPVIYEARGLPAGAAGSSAERMSDADGTTAAGTPFRVEARSAAANGVAVFCEGGYSVGTTVYDNDGKVIKEWPKERVRPQHAFIEALRSGRWEDLRPEILEGHLSTAMCHMGNISVQCGEAVSFADAAARLQSDRHAAAALGRMAEHLKANGLDPASSGARAARVTLGATLTMDSKTERFTGAGSQRANWFIKDSYRAPFVIPEEV